MDIIGVKNPYGLVQQAGRRKRRTHRQKRTLRRKSLRKTRKNRN
jgi:hypothetical protein